MQVVDHCADELGKATLRIKVFVAKNENAVLLASALGGDEKRARVTQMQVSGRRRRVARDMVWRDRWSPIHLTSG